MNLVRRIDLKVLAITAKILRFLVRKPIPASRLEWDNRLANGQYAEDLVLDALIQSVDLDQPSFYVDVGAHHPDKLSNTRRFYKRGWRGINIDPNPDGYYAFVRERKRDINLQIAISLEPGQTKLHLYKNAPELNRITQSDETAVLSLDGRYSTSSIKVETSTLRDVLSKHAGDVPEIGFMNIDCEGTDIDVLRSGDWNRYRPVIVLIEAWDTESFRCVNDFLSSAGYEYHLACMGTRFYVRNDRIAWLRDSARNGTNSRILQGIVDTQIKRALPAERRGAARRGEA
jgi:FkbM family methyltransferase